jgi:hypothetical protein
VVKQYAPVASLQRCCGVPDDIAGSDQHTIIAAL